jgi:hypothetical protein
MVKQCLPFSSLFFSLPKRESGWLVWLGMCSAANLEMSRKTRDPLSHLLGGRWWWWWWWWWLLLFLFGCLPH